jgi:hypothetical protein
MMAKQKKDRKIVTSVDEDVFNFITNLCEEQKIPVAQLVRDYLVSLYLMGQGPIRITRKVEIEKQEEASE